MSLLWLEGFEADPNITDSLRKYEAVTTGGGTPNTLGGRWGGLAIRSGDLDYRTPNLGNKSVAIIGCNLKRTTAAANMAESLLFKFLDGTNEQIAVYLLSDGSGFTKFRVKRGSTVIGTTTNSWSPLFWILVEFKVVLDTNGSDGSVEIKVNSISELLVAATDTTNYASLVWNRAVFGARAASGETALDDVYILDTAGAKNNTWMGEHTIQGFNPNANGNRNQWTKWDLGGTHYDAVNEGVIDDDTTYLYVHNTDDGLVELFGWTDSTFLTEPIHGLHLEFDLRMDTGSSDNVRPIFRNGGGTEATGTTIGVTNVSAYLRFFEIFENDPTIAGAWTIANWNAMQVGLESRP